MSETLSHPEHGVIMRAGIALHKLARCYERGKDLDAAARCYEANLARIDAEQLQGQDAPDALLFLATYKKVSCLKGCKIYFWGEFKGCISRGCQLGATYR